MEKKVIWTNNLNYDEVRNSYEEYFPDSEGYSEGDRISIMYDINNENYLQVVNDLNQCSIDNDIVVFAKRGLWHGVYNAYKVTSEGIGDIIRKIMEDYVEIFVEENELQVTAIHHDGTNHFTFRALKPFTDRYDFDRSVDEIGLAKAFEKLTVPLGKHVAEYYGW